MSDHSEPAQSGELLDEETERLIWEYGRVSGGYFAKATQDALRSRIRTLVEEARHKQAEADRQTVRDFR